MIEHMYVLVNICPVSQQRYLHMFSHYPRRVVELLSGFGMRSHCIDSIHGGIEDFADH